MLSRVQLFCDPMNYSLQASLSIEFSRLEYWSGYNFLLQEIHPNPGIEPASSVSPALQADSLPSEPLGNLLVCTFYWASLVAQ